MTSYAYLPDTSVIYNGIITKLIVSEKILGYSPELVKNVRAVDKLVIVLSKVMLAEVENQANQIKSKENMGLQTLDELHKLKKLGIIDLEITGERPKFDHIKLNPGGELDALIRNDAYNSESILITSDNVQASIARVEEIDVLFMSKFDIDELLEDEDHSDKDEEEFSNYKLEDFFDDTSMSVHLRGNCVPQAKRGEPGKWILKPLSENVISTHIVEKIGNNIIRRAKNDEHSFIERNEPGVTVVQLRTFRIVICRPPFSDIHEITAVRPLVSLSLEDYSIEQKVRKRLDWAEGILVAGRPGSGKSTFISALIEHYQGQNKLIKTIESVRDLDVPDEVAQYGELGGSFEGTADILLLIRPDYTIFDEVRTKSDFKIFADMRLSGIGLVGVVHASKPVDAIQRFISRIEMGIIPNVIDTVIFIEEGDIARVLEVSMTVKAPVGFRDKDLARPVIEVTDFVHNELLYEIYDFGGNTVVNKVGGDGYQKKRNNQYDRSKPQYAKHFDQKSQKGNYRGSKTVKILKRKKNYMIELTEPKYFAKYVTFSTSNGDRIFSASTSQRGTVNIRRASPIYNKIQNILRSGQKIIPSMDE